MSVQDQTIANEGTFHWNYMNEYIIGTCRISNVVCFETYGILVNWSLHTAS